MSLVKRDSYGACFLCAGAPKKMRFDVDVDSVCKLMVTAPRGGEWHGLVRDTWVEVSSEWVNGNFKSFFLRECRASSGKALHVPVGRAATAGAPPLLHNIDNPFPQRDCDACVPYSAAAALNYVGAIDSEGHTFFKDIAALGAHPDLDAIRSLTMYITHRVPGWRAAACSPDVLSNIPPETVIVAQLEASDGDISHAVAIVRGIIFDANFAHAVELSTRGLDACCLGNTTTFVRIKRAVQLVPGPRVLRLMKRAAHGGALC